jgi:hypothetical protein
MTQSARPHCTILYRQDSWIDERTRGITQASTPRQLCTLQGPRQRACPRPCTPLSLTARTGYGRL